MSPPLSSSTLVPTRARDDRLSPLAIDVNTVTTMGRLKDHIRTEHAALRPHIELIRTTADAVGETSLHVLRGLTESVLGFAIKELLPHAEHENELLYRAVEEALHAPGSTRTMSRDHIEIRRYLDELTTLSSSILEGHELERTTVRDLRRVLYGLHAIVALHFEKEDEVYAALLEAKLPNEEQDRLLAELSRH